MCENAPNTKPAPIPCARLVSCGIIGAAADPWYAKQVLELATARDHPEVLYCATSGRSAMAAAVLQMMGFRDVLALDGGDMRGVDEGMPELQEASYDGRGCGAARVLPERCACHARDLTALPARDLLPYMDWL